MLTNFLQRAIAKPYRLLMAASMAMALTACGGGGGSPGTVPGTQPPVTGPTPASIVLSTSSDTMPGSGLDGTEVVLTAIVKDAGNNAMADVTVSFTSSSGTISNTVRKTNAQGVVTEKLSVKGDPTARDITITASAGGLTSNAKIVKVLASASVPPKLLLTASSGTLNSAGEVGTEVEIRALVIDTNNVVVPNSVVTFSTNSGSLSASQATTNAAGIATVKLNTASDPTTRTITVTGRFPGTPDATVDVNVVGTKIALNAASTLNINSTSDITAVLTNSLGNPIANTLMTFSSSVPTGNSLTVKGGGSAITDSAGKLVLSYKPSVAGDNVITVGALGVTATVKITTVSSDFTIATATAEAATEGCHLISVRNFLNNAPVAGSVTISSSRGTVYTNSLCTTQLAGSAIALSNGLASAYVKSTSPGVATLSATYVSPANVTGATVQNTVEFVAPLTSVSVISLQATPAVVGANSSGSTKEQSVLRAVVTDKASQGNPVKGAKVAFSILADPSGGTLSQPTEVLTGADGSATVSYIAGTTTTAVDGVVIQAQVQSPISAASNTTKLTVGQRSLFISAGTGNSILTPNDTQYAVNYSVFVTDAAGNPVRDVTVTGAIRPRNYYKGIMVLQTANGPWVPEYHIGCANEDSDSDGFLGIGEDRNSNTRLDPVIPMNITSSGKTDASGTAIVTITYPKDRAYWIDVDFTIRGLVSGSEARYVGYTMLRGLSTDYKDASVSPPGAVSPYGVSYICEDTK
jgi:hypothetical protein